MSVSKKSDLIPPLGYPGGPCFVVKRVDTSRSPDRIKERLIDKVEDGDKITNPEASKVYRPLVEKGQGRLRMVLSPHAQYRMDLRGVTVPEVRLALRGLMSQYSDFRSQKDPRGDAMQQAMQRGTPIEYYDKRSGLFTVFSFKDKYLAMVVTCYWKGLPDPVAPLTCLRFAYNAPVTELGTLPARPSPAQLGLPAQNSVVAPFRSPTQPFSGNDVAVTPQMTSIKPEGYPGRFPGVEGQPHPVVPGQSIPGPRSNLVAEELVAEDSDEKGAYKRERKQRGQSKRKRQQRYRKNKQKVKLRAKKWYRKNRNKSKFKRQVKLRRKFPKRFRRRIADMGIGLVRNEDFVSGYVESIMGGKVTVSWEDGKRTSPTDDLLRDATFMSEEDIEAFVEHDGHMAAEMFQYDQEQSYETPFEREDSGVRPAGPFDNTTVMQSPEKSHVIQQFSRYRMSHDLRGYKLMRGLLTTKLWQDYEADAASEDQIVGWFNSNGHGMTLTEWHSIQDDLSAMARISSTPVAPYSNRPSKVVRQRGELVLWKVQYGSKALWMITDMKGQMVSPHDTGFSKRRDAFTAWSEMSGPSEAQVNFAQVLFKKLVKNKWMEPNDALTEEEIQNLGPQAIGELITELKKIRDEKQVWKALPYLKSGVPPRWVKKGSRSVVAAKAAEIFRGIDDRVVDRSSELSVKLKRLDKKSKTWTFSVTGSNTYTVRIKAVPASKNITNFSSSDVLVNCNCNYWRWQGPEHWALEESYLLGSPQGSASTPSVRDPESSHRVCKHAYAALKRAEGFFIPMSRKSSDNRSMAGRVARRYLEEDTDANV